MAVELRNVDTLAPPPGYSHVAVGRGGTVVFTAGALHFLDFREVAQQSHSRYVAQEFLPPLPEELSFW